jgi:hypothetical protein
MVKAGGLPGKAGWANERMKRMEYWTRFKRAGLLGLLWLGGGLICLADDNEPLLWRWSNPAPHGNNIVDMSWSSAAGYAVQVTERGGLYTSEDLERWIPRASGTKEALRSAAFLGKRLVITGASGTVLYADGPERVQAGELLDGPTPDWLEAVAVADGLAVAVGDNGAVYRSEDGVRWQREESGVTDWLRGVTHGNGIFVAVGEDSAIITSEDGQSWDRVESEAGADLNRVGFMNDVFVAVGDEGLIKVSADGTNWEQRSIGATGHLYDVTAGPGGWLVVGDGECWINEGNTWINQLPDPAGGLPSWTYYAAMGGSDWFLIAGRTGVTVDGLRNGTGKYEWSMQGSSPRHWLFDVVWTGNQFVAVGDRANVVTSGTGVDWEIEDVPASLTNSIFLGIGGTTNLLVAAGNQGSLMISPNMEVDLVLTNSSGTVITQNVSTIGVVWHAVDPQPTTRDLQGITFHDGHYYVVGEDGMILRGADGTNWTQRIVPTTGFLSGIAGFAGGLVASGDDGALVYSADGDDWEAVESGTTNWLYRVRSVHEQLLAVGQNGVMLASVDGLDWSPRNTGTDRWLYDVTTIDDQILVVGAGGTVLRSMDGVGWESVGTLTGKVLSGVANDGRRIVVVGGEGVILRSLMVPDLTPIEILSYSRIQEAGADTVQNVFLFRGNVDQRFTLDYRSSLSSGMWNVGPTLEFRESEGTLIHLESLDAANAPAEEYYRGTVVP